MSLRPKAVGVRKKPEGRYHHGELRRALIEATGHIIDREGTGAVSLSAAARRVGVSPQASYNHFRDKSALLAAVAEVTVFALETSMRQASAAPSTPGARLEATGVAYVTFAAANPARFRLLGAPELTDKAPHPHLVAAYDSAYGVLVEAIRECQSSGVVREGDPRELAVAAWSTVHGAASLVVDGQLTMAREAVDAARVARDVVRVLFRGLSVGRSAADGKKPARRSAR